ncbi:MAG: FG-GAP-like repeat-containing protein, partial [Planctomycetaceae bacterium]|nr:FG-GAP-like repeat-containing protein [Planctomycetaceae bacterium]
LVGWGKAMVPPLPPAEGNRYVDASGGISHMLGLYPDGSVRGWGTNIYGETTVPVGLGPCTAVAAGSNHSLALKADGTVAAWGRNNAGQTTVPSTLGACKRIAAGGLHSAAIRVDGTLRCWGDNSANQQLHAGQAAIDMAVGEQMTVLIRPDGSVIGSGTFLQGVRTTTAYSTPANLPAMKKVSVRTHHVVGLSTAGEVRVWCRFTDGQATVPTTLGTCIDVAAGSTYSIALKPDGSVAAWGSGEVVTTPPAVSGGARVFSGNTTGGMIKSDGSALAWGNNDYGLVAVPGTPVVPIDFCVTTTHRTVLLDATGSIDTIGVAMPTTVPKPTNLGRCTQISSLYDHILALKQDGTVAAWGRNVSGQCTVPPSLSGVVQVAAGAEFSLALRGDGSFVGWGSGTGGATFDAGVGPFVRIAAGHQHSLGLRADGTVVGSQGSNTNGQVTIPSNLGACQAMAAGFQHSMGLRVDGSVAAWGSNSFGVCNVPTSLGACQQIAAGAYHSVALRTDGTVAAWGSNVYGELNVVPGFYTRVVAGGNSVLALASDACTTASRSGNATIAFPGSYWRYASVWSWSDGKIGVPGSSTFVDLGTYGSVKTDCAAQAGTFTARAASKLYVNVACSAGDCPTPTNESLAVSATANLAGTLKVDFLGCDGCTEVPESFDAAPVLSAGAVSGMFELLQSSLPPPAGRFLTLVPETVNGRTVLTLRLFDLSRGAQLSGGAAGAFTGRAVAASALDLNGDGYDDLAVAIDFGAGQAGLLQVLFSDGQGNVGGTSLLKSLPPQPTCLTTGDVNADGRRDVVVGVAGDATVRVYLDNAQSGLTDSTVLSNLGGSPTCVVVIPPVGAALLPSGATIGVGTSGNKLRTYSAGGTMVQEVALAGTPGTVRGGNTTGSGGTTIVTGGTTSATITGSSVGSGFVQALEVTAQGLAITRTIAIDGNPVSLDVADLDADGVDDVVTANAAPATGGSGGVLPVLSIIRSVGGVLSDPVPLQPEGASAGVCVTLADVDVDGDRDIVVIHQAGDGVNQASLLRIDTSGAGTPLAIGKVTALPGAQPVIAVRANLDGGVGEDLFLVDQSGGTQFIASGQVTPYLAVRDPLPGDLDGDDAVTNADIALLLLDFGPCPGCASDVDRNGVVDNGDIAYMLLLFG